MTSAPAHSENPRFFRRTPRGVLFLCLATVIWGTTFIVIRQLVVTHRIPPSLVNLGRFTLGALLLSPFLTRDRQLWIAGFELGFWLWAGYATQSVGLVDTGAGRSAFITALYVVFTPTLAILAGRRVPSAVVIAALIALDGTALLSFDITQPGRGEAWTVVSALVWSVYIIRLESRSKQFEGKSLTAVQLAVVALLCVPWVLIEGMAAPSHLAVAIAGPAILRIIYLGVVATALTTWLQTVGQQTVPAPQASLLYSMEPVWAAFFAWLATGETFGPPGWIGAAAILLAATLSQWPAKKSVVRDLG